MSIVELSNYDLIEMYEACIKSDHYDPPGDSEDTEFSKHECRIEIQRRMPCSGIGWGDKR